jgi:hypothetical protein
MTECTRQKLIFSSLNRQKVEADFDGGRLTSDAGILWLREVSRRTGLIDAWADCITDHRDPAKLIHDLTTMLSQRIFGIAAGYEDLNDHHTLRDDPAFQLLAEQSPTPDNALASPSTLCRFENCINRQALVQMAAVLVDQFIASHRRPPKELVLDFDATDDPVHGQQEKRFFHGYYDHYCFLPLYVFCGSHLLCAYLRPSNIDAAKHARAILRLVVERLRKAWPKVRLIFRGDSGFCRWKLLRWCERHRVDYVVGLARNPVLERMAEPYMTRAAERFERTGRKQRSFYAIRYAAQTWDRQRRVIVKAEHLSQGPNCRFVVTSLHAKPRRVYDKWYTPRGDMENRIKEQQLGLFADRTSCHKFVANQFRLLLASAAYVLIDEFRRTGLVGTELACAQVDSVRLKVFKVAARVRTSVRRITFHLSSTYPYPRLFARLPARLVTVPPPH